MTRAATLMLSALALAACGSGSEPAETPAAPTEAPAPEPTTAPEPTGSDPALDRLVEDTAPVPGEDDVAPAAPVALAEHAPPARGCALQTESAIRVLPGGGPPVVIAHGDAFLLAAYDAQGVRILRARPGALPEPLASIALESPSARASSPGLARTGEREVAIAVIDGGGRLLEATFDPTMPATAVAARAVAASGADARFAPAVRAVGTRRVIAWTDGSATPMRLRLAVIERERVVSEHDVTPVAGGGAVPFFVEGDGAPLLFFIDPRVAVSVVHRVALGADGVPGTTEVQRPVNRAATPAAIAAARAAGRTWLAYAADGSLATRAVGLVDASGTDSPAPLVPGLGYGDPLAIDALAAGSSAVFAVEAPSAVEASAPHEVRVRRVDGSGAGEPLVIAGPAIDPSIARRDDGVIAVAYRASDTVLLHYARCAE